jgi:hypothetical protein
MLSEPGRFLFFFFVPLTTIILLECGYHSKGGIKGGFELPIAGKPTTRSSSQIFNNSNKILPGLSHPASPGGEVSASYFIFQLQTCYCRTISLNQFPGIPMRIYFLIPLESPFYVVIQIFSVLFFSKSII